MRLKIPFKTQNRQEKFAIYKNEKLVISKSADKVSNLCKYRANIEKYCSNIVQILCIYCDIIGKIFARSGFLDQVCFARSVMSDMSGLLGRVCLVGFARTGLIGEIC